MRYLIIGCGRVGSGLANELTLRGHQVTVVDKDPQAIENLGPVFKGRAIVGFGFDREVLEAAGIQRADGLAAVTASDEANVIAARIARDIYRVPRVVARLFDPRQAEIYKRMGLQTISPVAWGIHRIADLLLYTELEPVFSIGSGDVSLLETQAPPLLTGKSVNDLTIIGEIHVIAITRGGKTILPTRGTLFAPGDIIHLAVLASSINRLKQLLEG
jgi:trk system potassium uptake protein TrkA